MPRRIFAASVCFLLFVMLQAGSMHGRAPQQTVVIDRQHLCVTDGTVEAQAGQRLSVTAAAMRAYAMIQTQQDATARFTYLGGTAKESRLGSGQVRRQFGLKMHSQDPCNLVYVMWRIEPESKLVVSIKSNPGQHTSAECHNHGYTNIKPRRGSPVPVLRPGATHSLRAVMNGEELRVFEDDRPVWEGTVGREAAALRGPIGMRSDNAKLEIELSAGRAAGAQGPPIACRQGESE